MEKMKMESVDGVQKNIERIEQLFPNCITEALDLERSTAERPVYKKAINFELLKQMLSDEALAGDEAYEMTWVGKKASIVEANKPIRKTLRPCPEESVNWDTTENLYIEGDNLEALKLLQESYLGKVDLIYIDPPYNTGDDLIYRDSFSTNFHDYLELKDVVDDDGNRLIKNAETNGRFHSDWCSMIYSRLLLSRNLLSETGVIAISIDDNEISNLKYICNEVFGEENFVGTIVWQKIHSIKNDAKYLSVNHEYAVIYSRNIQNLKVNLLPRTEEMNNRYKNPDNDPRGPWQSGDLVASGERSQGHFIVKSPLTGKEFDVPNGKHWVYSKDNLEKLVSDDQIWFGSDGNSFPRKKRFLKDVQNGRTPSSLWLADEVGHNQSAARDLKSLFDNRKVFDFPKPVDYVKRFIQLFTSQNSIILDFFAGSSTTAEAVMKINHEDNGNRKFILIQIPELIDNKKNESEQFDNICEIGMERIVRASQKFRQNSDENEEDLGFRVFKIDRSNYLDVFANPTEITQGNLFEFQSNLRDDSSELDLFFGCILDWGLPLSLPYSIEHVGGFTVHNYNNGDLVACFNKKVSEELVREIASRRPLRAVFRDSSFENSPDKINAFEIFKKYMPEDSDDITRRLKVI